RGSSERREERSQAEQKSGDVRVPRRRELDRAVRGSALYVPGPESLSRHRPRLERRYGDNRRYAHAERAPEIGYGQRHLQQHEYGCRRGEVDGREAVEYQGPWNQSDYPL